MINVTAKPFRMIASGSCEKLNRELIACFVGHGNRAPWQYIVCLKEAYCPVMYFDAHLI